MPRRSGALFNLQEHRVVELAETRLTLIKGFATHIRSSIEVWVRSVRQVKREIEGAGRVQAHELRDSRQLFGGGGRKRGDRCSLAVGIHGLDFAVNAADLLVNCLESIQVEFLCFAGIAGYVQLGLVWLFRLLLLGLLVTAAFNVLLLRVEGFVIGIRISFSF